MEIRVNLYLKFTKFGTGDTCPASGIWQAIGSKKPILLSKGEYFPHHDGEIVRWEHKKSYEPNPADLQLLKESS